LLVNIDYIIKDHRMYRLISGLIILTLFLADCRKSNDEPTTCITDKVKEFSGTAICETGASVSLYVFKGENVYLFFNGTCGADLASAVYTEDCEYLGFLGGIAGNMTISGVNFYDEAKFVRKIWED
jgi:hypothetical protein